MINDLLFNDLQTIFTVTGIPFLPKMRCDCGKSFSYKKNLVYHKRHDCGRFYPCPVCRKPFSQKSNLRSHIIALHPYSFKQLLWDKITCALHSITLSTHISLSQNFIQSFTDFLLISLIDIVTEIDWIQSNALQESRFQRTVTVLTVRLMSFNGFNKKRNVFALYIARLLPSELEKKEF